MGSASFTIISDTFTPKILNAPKYIPTEVRQVLEVLVETVADVARGYCPVDTGYLRSTIYGDVTGDLEGEVGAGADYAWYVEDGTRFMDAQPFILPALVAMAPDVQKALLQALMDAFNHA